jgi:hypothetical protein
MPSSYHELVKESEGLSLSSKELLCLESTREAWLGYTRISDIPLFYVCVRIYIVAA